MGMIEKDVKRGTQKGSLVLNFSAGSSSFEGAKRTVCYDD